MPTNAHISIAEVPQQESLFIRCEGRCTMGICPAIRSKVADLSQSDLRHIYIDLSQTEGIDSTFTGFLLTLRQRSKPEGPTLHLVAPSPGVMRSLETMQVHRLMNFVDALPANDVTWTPLEATSLDEAQTTDLIIDAHETLIEADERNRDAFGHVVEGFRRDREQHDDSHDAQG